MCLGVWLDQGEHRKTCQLLKTIDVSYIALITSIVETYDVKIGDIVRSYSSKKYSVMFGEIMHT